MNTGTPRSDARSAVEDRSPEDIARTVKLDKGLGFLVRLLDTRATLLYEQIEVRPSHEVGPVFGGQRGEQGGL